MTNSLNELKRNFTREHDNVISTTDRLYILEFYRHDNNHSREQVKDLHEILNEILNLKIICKIYIKKIHSSMNSPNLSVNIDNNIAAENFSEKFHDITTIDFSINESLLTSNSLHLEIPL